MSWFSAISRQHMRPAKRRSGPAARRRSFMPRLEILEDRTVPSGYQQINLVAEVPGVAPTTDPNLDGWGMVALPNGYMVADAPLGIATFYDAHGNVLPGKVTVPPAPSQPLGPISNDRGIEANPTSEFVISEGGRSAPAVVLFGTKDGTISGWNPAVDPDHAIIMVDNSAEVGSAVNHAMYSSVHIAQNSKGQTILYAADRGHNRVDMFDGQFHFLGSFSDKNVLLQSAGHPGAWQVEDAPNGNLFVLYTEELGPQGPYGGIVDEFDTDGNLLTPNHFAANGLGAGPLEGPWGITQAPADFGEFSNDILIGNDEGPGYINAFDPNTGLCLGHLTHPDGTPIAIPGLWYLTFGGGTPQTGLTKQLYFVAGPSLGHNFGQGLFGRIIAAGEGDSPDSRAGSGAGMAGQVSTTQGTGPAQTALLLGALSPSGASQGTSTANDAGGLQTPATDASIPVTAQQTLPNAALASEPILQSGNSRPTTDVLDSLFAGFTNGKDDEVGKLPL
jgi:uncharacterized protein (TIGR03118 family)